MTHAKRNKEKRKQKKKLKREHMLLCYEFRRIFKPEDKQKEKK
jgi:hypothetical protein